MERLTEQALEFDKVKAYLAQLTYSLLGKMHIEAMGATTERKRIEQWLTEISELKEIRALHGHLPFGGVRDIHEPLSRCRIEGAILEPLAVRQIYDTLRAGRIVKKFIAELESSTEEWRYPLIRDTIAKIHLVNAVEVAIERSIDEEGEILDSASPQLKRIRKDLRLARDKIQTWLQNFLQRQDHQSAIQDQVITMCNNRYVIPIKASSKGKIKGIVHDQSSSGVTVFLEPLATVELNNRIATLEAEEKQEILRILLELTNLIREHVLEIEGTMIVLGELDFLNAKTRLSEQWNANQPKLTDRRTLNLMHARHPLLLLQHKENQANVVPIDVSFDEDYSTLLITGPNTGGKTVSLKTIGLLTLMTQAGLHIPVSKDSELCIFDKIFADIGDQQSIEQNLSTFSSHISHIVEILAHVNDRSLVLLDELGAGTDPAEGASLGVAILEYLDRVNAKCMATTHHDALKAYAYTHPRTINACVEFDVNTLSPTYHLLFGIPGKSNAFIIAERLGVPNHIIQRAKSLMGEDQLQVDHLIRKLTRDSEEIDRKKAEIDARYRGVLRLEQETDKLMASTEQKQQHILNSALEEAKIIVEQAARQAQEMLSKLPALTREQGNERVKSLHKEAAKISKTLNQRKTPKVSVTPSVSREAIRPGAKVRLTGFDQTGTILKLSKDGAQAEVQVGIMRVEMPVQQLSPLASSPLPPQISVSDFSMTSSQEHIVPFELVIVGKRVDDALEDVNKYLDQAFLSGFSSVSIVHGIGTGKLKKAVSNLLRSHPHVVKYALDEQNYGMTNVELVRK